MRIIPRVEYKNAVGLADKFVGLGKELWGEVIDSRRLIEAGEAQQGKGTEPQDDAGHIHEGPTLARGRGDPHAVEDDSTQGITGHT